MHQVVIVGGGGAAGLDLSTALGGRQGIDVALVNVATCLEAHAAQHRGGDGLDLPRKSGEFP